MTSVFYNGSLYELKLLEQKLKTAHKNKGTAFVGMDERYNFKEGFYVRNDSNGGIVIDFDTDNVKIRIRERVLGGYKLQVFFG